VCGCDEGQEDCGGSAERCRLGDIICVAVQCVALIVSPCCSDDRAGDAVLRFVGPISA
jgi:hypothetical protein